MIRSRSFIPNYSLLPLNIPSVPGTPDSILSSPLGAPRPSPFSGGLKLWKYLCFVIVAGINVYYIIAQNTLSPRRVESGSRLSKKVTIVLNTFKRNSMMQGVE